MLQRLFPSLLYDNPAQINTVRNLRSQSGKAEASQGTCSSMFRSQFYLLQVLFPIGLVTRTVCIVYGLANHCKHLVVRVLNP